MNAKRLGFMGIGSVLVVLGVLRLVEPSSQAPSGRWSLVLGPIYESFGSFGLGFFFVALGGVMFTVGVLFKGDQK